MRALTLSILLWSGIQGAPASQTTTLEGPVSDAVSGRPIPGAEVRLVSGTWLSAFPEPLTFLLGADSVLEPEQTTTTDASGRFRFEAVEPGPYRLGG
jgi:protocatechuate 3,4-dioxygenase beta subunit